MPGRFGLGGNKQTRLGFQPTRKESSTGRGEGNLFGAVGIIVGIVIIALISVFYFFVWDATPPATVGGLTINDYNNGKLYLEWTSSDDASVVKYYIYRNGVKLADTSVAHFLDTGLTTAVSYSYQITAVDASGNESELSTASTGISQTESSLSLNGTDDTTTDDTTTDDTTDDTTDEPVDYSTDTIVPALSDPSPEDEATTTDSTPAISIKYSDNTGLNQDKTVWTIDGDEVDGSVETSSAAIYFTPTAALSQGEHTIKVTVEDLGANTISQTWKITVDSEGPTYSMLRPLSGGSTTSKRPTISGMYSDTSDVDYENGKFWLDSMDVSSITSFYEQNFFYNPPSDLSLGTHTVKLEMKDELGKTSSIEWNFTITT